MRVEDTIVQLPTFSYPEVSALCVHPPKITTKAKDPWTCRSWEKSYMRLGVEKSKLERYKLRWWEMINSLKYIHFRIKCFLFVGLF